MTTQLESPILKFLTDKENLPAVLEVLRYGNEIREKVLQDFCTALEEALKQRRPSTLAIDLSWRTEPIELPIGGKTDQYFGLDARLGSTADKAQALRYSIELHVVQDSIDYVGFGLAFVNQEKDFEKTCRMLSLQRLRRQLKETRQGDLDSEPNEWWIWFEHWRRDIRVDQWLCLVQGKDSHWFEKETRSFWGFVEQTHVLVSEANEALKRL